MNTGNNNINLNAFSMNSPSNSSQLYRSKEYTQEYQQSSFQGTASHSMNFKQQAQLNGRPGFNQKMHYLQTRPINMMQQPKTNPSEICSRHGEANVGWSELSKEVVCNTCIYEKKLNQLKFTALMSKELKDSFEKSFQKYKESLNTVQEIDPNLVKLQLKKAVNDFFNDLSTRVKQLEVGVMEKIKQSESLKELEKILESNKEFFKADQTQPDHFEKEKQTFDQKIQKG